MNTIGKFCIPCEQNITSWNNRLMVLGVVVAFHGLAMVLWFHGSRHEASPADALEISFEVSVPHTTSLVKQASRVEAVAQPPQNIQPAPAKQVQVVEKAQAEPAAETTPVTTQPVAAAPAMPAVVKITEPDYKASYLNNTPPGYPLAARRMGMQGRVLLHVEVLAAGVSGKIEVSQSSGHAMLDMAAMNAVKGWHFIPATQAGQAVDKWFIIPIQFSLKEV